MDKDARKRFDWLPVEMPGVARLVKEKRAQLGEAFVNECWQRGVMRGEPGWFFAREGTLAVGTPWDAGDAAMANFAAAQVSSTQALLCLAIPVGSQ